MPRKKMLEECPNCGSSWGPGSEEWQFQECDTCDYPDPACKNFMRDVDDDGVEQDYDDFYEEPDYDMEGRP